MKEYVYKAVKAYVKNDMDGILKCIYEIYQQDNELLYIKENIELTILDPFLRMIEDRYTELKKVEIHLYMSNVFMDNVTYLEFKRRVQEKLLECQKDLKE